MVTVIPDFYAYRSAEFGHYLIPVTRPFEPLSVKDGLAIVCIPDRWYCVVTAPLVANLKSEWIAAKVRRSLLQLARRQNFDWHEAILLNEDYADLTPFGGGQVQAIPEAYPAIASVCEHHQVKNIWVFCHDSNTDSPSAI